MSAHRCFSLSISPQVRRKSGGVLETCEGIARKPPVFFSVFFKEQRRG